MHYLDVYDEKKWNWNLQDFSTVVQEEQTLKDGIHKENSLTDKENSLKDTDPSFKEKGHSSRDIDPGLKVIKVTSRLKERPDFLQFHFKLRSMYAQTFSYFQSEAEKLGYDIFSSESFFETHADLLMKFIPYVPHPLIQYRLVSKLSEETVIQHDRPLLQMGTHWAESKLCYFYLELFPLENIKKNSDLVIQMIKNMKDHSYLSFILPMLPDLHKYTRELIQLADQYPRSRIAILSRLPKSNLGKYSHEVKKFVQQAKKDQERLKLIQMLPEDQLLLMENEIFQWAKKSKTLYHKIEFMKLLPMELREKYQEWIMDLARHELDYESSFEAIYRLLSPAALKKYHLELFENVKKMKYIRNRHAVLSLLPQPTLVEHVDQVIEAAKSLPEKDTYMSFQIMKLLPLETLKKTKNQWKPIVEHKSYIHELVPKIPKRKSFQDLLLLLKEKI